MALLSLALLASECLLQDNFDNSVNLYGPPLRFIAGNTYHVILKNELTVPYDEEEVRGVQDPAKSALAFADGIEGVWRLQSLL